MGHIEGGQSRATAEHITHIYHFGGVETEHIEGGQSRATVEHGIYGFHH